MNRILLESTAVLETRTKTVDKPRLAVEINILPLRTYNNTPI